MPDDGVIYMGWQEEAFAGIRGRLEAENVRLRAALENIKALGCILLLEGEGEKDCSDKPYTCAQCMARAALEEK